MYKTLFSVLVIPTIFAACEKECPEPECADVDLEKGLLAYYPFNGNSNDESGNGNNAVAYNGAHLGADFLGRPSKAAEFDGIDDYFLVQDNGKLNTEQVSVSMMIWVSNRNRRQSFLNRVNTDNATSFIYGLGQSLDETNRWDFGVGSPSSGCNVPLTYEDGIYARSSQTSVEGQWYHLIGIFNSSDQKLYVDGELRASIKRSFEKLGQCSDAKLIIGGWWKNDIVSVSGKVDDIRIYNRQLSDCEIKELSKVFKN